MRYYFAPMEGITTALYRNLHHRFFPGMDQYYTPFLSPARDHVFSKRDLQEILPEHQEGVPVVPQLLTKYPEDFIWAAGELAAMGYQEVNLNLGCPSGTVVAKGRGAGMLEDLEFLERFLDQIFSACPSLHISIKTRLGISSEDSFPKLLELYNRYPIWELTVHPRVQKDFYKHEIRWQAFAVPPLPVPWGDMEAAMEAHRLPLWALESQDPVRDFDMIAFTIGYEMSYSNVVNMLRLSQVPIYSRDRQGLRNLVFAGGVCAFNPEPLADFVDFFSLGEGEESTVEIVSLYQKAKREDWTKDRFLEAVSHIPGVYVMAPLDGRMILTFHEP